MKFDICHNPQVLFQSTSQPVSSQPALVQRVTPPQVHNFALHAAFVGPYLQFLFQFCMCTTSDFLSSTNLQRVYFVKSARSVLKIINKEFWCQTFGYLLLATNLTSSHQLPLLEPANPVNL